MERFVSDQPSMASHAVVNYSSSSYGGFLFRSPNSPPPPPPFLSPPPSVASLSQLFLGARFNYGSRSPVYCSSPAGFFQQPQPPLLPLPRSATLPAPSKRIQTATPTASVRSRRHNAKRKGKVSTAERKETSPPPMKVKEERKPAITTKGNEKDDSHPWPMKMTTVEKREIKLAEEEEEIILESVYSLSPPPSSLPFPTFSLTRPKASSRHGFSGGAVSGYCIA